jgi:hypothetical protein
MQKIDPRKCEHKWEPHGLDTRQCARCGVLGTCDRWAGRSSSGPDNRSAEPALVSVLEKVVELLEERIEKLERKP